MRSLFFKVFIIFWIAQSLIFVISTALILSRRFPGPVQLGDPLIQGLRRESSEAVSAFESGGCAALNSNAQEPPRKFALEDASGRALCNPGNVPIEQAPSGIGAGITVRQLASEYLWTMPVSSASGKEYLYLAMSPQHHRPHTWYGDLLHFAFPQLPVAIAVGGATTFVLVLIFTRPVARLRKAARELAHGNLSARVKEAGKRNGALKGDEFKALVLDFNHMAERLESLVGAQKLLLRDVSHELRSPLARLSVALELSREDADEKMATHLDRIERETERLNQLIGQLLTLSSMEAVEGVNRFERVALKPLLEQMIPDAAYEARQRNASVVLRAECECEVEGRRELLYRAIENVVRNAIRYTEEGSEVEIRLSQARESSGPIAVIEVADRGPGIPEAEMKSIFEPFYRVDRARSANTGGFGVGLAIAERAVKLHGGEVKALNREGGGATVQMRLPLTAMRKPDASPVSPIR